MLSKHNMFPRTRGNLVVISGPSGSGKNTVLGRVLQTVPDLAYSISATTRLPREGEVDGRSYFFLEKDEFLAQRETGGFLETAEFCGNCYGTPRAFVEERLAAGEDVIMDIEIQGAEQVKQSMPEAVFIFLMPPSFAELHARIEHRGADSPEAIERRLRRAVDEVSTVVRYDYVVLNSDVDTATRQVEAIIMAERARVTRCACDSFVRGFEEEACAQLSAEQSAN